MKIIKVELSVKSINAAISELKKFERDLPKKMDEVCKRLAEIGAQEAQAHLVLANGNTGASIDPPVPIANGYKITMSGEDVYFIEFGTGNAADPHGFTPLVSVYPGSYSEQHAKKFSEQGFWYYAGERLEETPAYMPMYYAEKKIRAELPRIAREVFSK